MNKNIPIKTANPDQLLTATEEQYLGIYATGKTCSEAGFIMSRSARTAKAHLINLYHKFNVHNRAQLIAQAFAKGYLKAGHAFLLLLAINAGVADSTDYRAPRTGTRGSRSTRKERTDKTLEFKITEAWT